MVVSDSVGLVYAVIYYVVFRFFIVKFNFKTPGREDKQASVANTSASKLPFDVLDAMGGKENIKHLDACTRYVLKSMINLK